MTPVCAAFPLGEANQLAADADAAEAGVGGEHPELARTLVETLDPDATDDPAAPAGHGDLAGPGQLGDLVHGRTGRAAGPQAVLGHRVDLVGQIGDPLHERRVVARGSGEQLDLDRLWRFTHMHCPRHQSVLVRA
jgi:hypothetical protein